MASDGAVSETETKFSYDVFLSFRGEDTRNTFTCHLYNELRREGITTFMDDGELQYGDELGPTLVKAIDESRSSIVVFSENYADSSWCLKELVKIHECMKSKKQRVYPIFYKVDPSDVRHQSGSYGKAMAEHQRKLREDSQDVKKWKSVLHDIANLKGEHQGKDESRFINDFVRKILIKVSPKDLIRDEHIVGREYRVEEVKSLLDIKSRNITFLLGIHGAGGIGKTTLAKALYDSIYKHFEGSCFLSDVRENSIGRHGLQDLQQQLLSDTLGRSDIQLKRNVEIKTIKDGLGLKRVLIVLDDVDSIEQLKFLAKEPNWFGDGSRIIITTRDINLLNEHEVKKRYEVKLLNDQESLELFCRSAFGNSCPESNYEDLSYRAMRCCKGLPLALEVLGSHVKGEGVNTWKDALHRYEKSPHPGVQKVLRISYDGLPFVEKNIFLDIACFFKGQRFEYVERVVYGSESGSSADGMRTLVNKSLLTVNNDKCLGMHDLIQDMGREIVKEEAGNKVGERSRLWHHEDVCHVLTNDMRVRNIVPPHYLMHCDKDGPTAEDVLEMEHREMHKEAKRSIKEAAQLCSTVAVLVTSVVFAYAYTIPGGTDQNNGMPVFLSRVFLFYTMTDVVELVISLASAVMFLSILTSLFELWDFRRSHPGKLNIASDSLFFSLVCTMLTFSATVLLNFRLENHQKWASILFCCTVFFSVAIFWRMQFPLYKMVQRLAKRLFKTLKQAVPTTLINYSKKRAHKNLSDYH